MIYRVILTSHAQTDKAIAILNDLRKESFIYECIIKEYKSTRSIEQNARLWALHQKASDATGHSAGEMHEICLFNFFGAKSIGINKSIGVGYQTWDVPNRRSSKLNTKEFAEFMEKVEAFYATELDVTLNGGEICHLD